MVMSDKMRSMVQQRIDILICAQHVFLTALIKEEDIWLQKKNEFDVLKKKWDIMYGSLTGEERILVDAAKICAAASLTLGCDDFIELKQYAKKKGAIKIN